MTQEFLRLAPLEEDDFSAPAVQITFLGCGDKEQVLLAHTPREFSLCVVSLPGDRAAVVYMVRNDMPCLEKVRIVIKDSFGEAGLHAERLVRKWAEAYEWSGEVFSSVIYGVAYGTRQEGTQVQNAQQVMEFLKTTNRIREFGLELNNSKLEELINNFLKSGE